MSVKTDLIKYLLDQGKITLDEALTLAAGESNKEINESMFDGAVQGQKDIKAKKLEEFIDQTIEPHYEDDDESGEKILVSLDLDKCLSIMNSTGHRWYNVSTRTYDAVSKEWLVEHLKDQMRQCVKEFIEHNQNGEHEDYWSIDCGGYIVETRWYDEEHTEIEVEIMYVPERVSNFIKFNEIA